MSPKKLESVLKIFLKWERFTGSNHSRCIESFASQNVWRKLARSLSLMCWNMDFPGRLVVLV